MALLGGSGRNQTTLEKEKGVVWNAPLYKDPTFAGHKVPPEGSEIVIGSVFSGYLAFDMAQSHSTRGITNQKDTRQGGNRVKNVQMTQTISIRLLSGEQTEERPMRTSKEIIIIFLNLRFFHWRGRLMVSSYHTKKETFARDDVNEVAYDGKLHGYSGAIKRKRKMLIQISIIDLVSLNISIKRTLIGQEEEKMFTVSIVVLAGTAGTWSNWRNMHRTVERKQRHLAGHRVSALTKFTIITNAINATIKWFDIVNNPIFLLNFKDE
ncbi:hypothetical protein OUZ56_006686 [Daphnia magna]|uniref:Uncharacterized protein n=1 Tax=Daphnia magna TaxID=35525 RepID=A0ABQ9YXP0_9CRUS|nr:hypothetical protein OUZ56_006686 [Daphnia magna]